MSGTSNRRFFVVSEPASATAASLSPGAPPRAPPRAPPSVLATSASPVTASGSEDEQTVDVDSTADGGTSIAARVAGVAGSIGSAVASAAVSAVSAAAGLAYQGISSAFASSPQVNPTATPVTAVPPPPLPSSSTSASSGVSSSASPRATIVPPAFPAPTAPSIPATAASRNGGVVLDDATVTAIATKIAEVRRAQDKRAANSGIKRHIPTVGDAIVGTGVEEGMDKEKCPVGWETCGALATQAGACDPTDKRQIGQLSIARQELMPNGDIGTALCVPSKFAEDLPDKVSAKIMKIILQKLGMNVNLEGDDDVYV